MAIKLTVLCMLSVLVSCASLPKNAPQEFYEADASIRRMEKTKGDYTFPLTAARATAVYKESLKMLKESHSSQAKFSKFEAIDKALEAKSMADGVATMHSKVLQMDANQVDFQEALASLEAGPTASLDAGVEVTPTEIIPAPPTGLDLLRGSEVVSSLAYFAPGKTREVLFFHHEAVDALVKLLAKNQALKVELTGFADNRGARETNYKLALQRAETLADELRRRGVNEQQMQRQGEIEAAQGKGSGKGAANSGQFIRRVQAKITLM